MVDAATMIKRIQEMRDEGFLSDAILRDMVKRIKATDSDYVFVGVYLFNPEESELWLHNYMGEGTEYAKIPAGTGTCGIAVTEKQNQNLPDVTEVEDYVAFSRRAKSELVVLIRAGDEVFGLIDVDSREKEAFDAPDQEAIELVADKLAEVFMAERRQ